MVVEDAQQRFTFADVDSREKQSDVCKLQPCPMLEYK